MNESVDSIEQLEIMTHIKTSFMSNIYTIYSAQLKDDIYLAYYIRILNFF